jgi:hypothetical protein
MPGKNIRNVKPEKTAKKVPTKDDSTNVKTKTAFDRRQKVTPKRDRPVRAINRATKNRKLLRKSRTKKHNKEYTQEYKTVEERNLEGGMTQDMLTESGDFPKLCGPSRVVLIPVDPYLMHVYWEIDARDIETAGNRLAGKSHQLQPILRVFDITNAIFDETKHCGCFDITIDLLAGKWYVHLLDPGRSYFVDLGIKTESGIFYPIARSNVAETPRGCPQPEDTERCVFVSRNEASHRAIPQHQKAGQGGLFHRTSGDVTDGNEICFVPGVSSLTVAPDE